MRASALDAFLNRPFAVRALLALLEEGPLGAMQFIEASGYKDDEGAKGLREDLERWGLVYVEPATPGGKGHRISLTTPGRRVAELARAIGKPALRLRAIRTLAALIEAEPMTTREFVEASRYTPPNAKLLREDLESWGLIVTGNDVHGAPHAIELTSQGRKVAELCVELCRIVERTAKEP